MIPELGHLALIIALVLAVLQGSYPLFARALRINNGEHFTDATARAQFVFVLLSFIALVYSFVISDFSVRYVAANSNTAMPTIFKVSATWGAHEGSLLLWALIQSTWAMLVSLFSNKIPQPIRLQMLTVLGWVSVGLILFIIVTSNPFERLLNVPEEGRTLNPLLQDIGLAIHPPMLYLGYVGFSVPFAYAIAALLSENMTPAWVRWVRPWALASWTFLTLGIALGSWWAYYELGWGGWWFWDPVENASLLPWLVGTALIHSLAVAEKRGGFKTWTILLSIAAFSLSLLGTFLVRSGVLTSVHSFASDPARGAFILVFLLIVIGGSLLLFALKADRFRAPSSHNEVSRETGILINNMLLTVITLVVLIGTLAPLFADVFSNKLSVGKPFYDTVVVPIAFLLFLFMGFGLLLRWKGDSFKRIQSSLAINMVLSIVAAVLFSILYTGGFDFATVLWVWLAVWVVIGALLPLLRDGRSLGKLPLSMWSASLGHIGMAVCVMGMAIVSLHDVERDVRMGIDQQTPLQDYQLKFKGVEDHSEANYIGQKGTVEIYDKGDLVATVHPEKRNYGQGTMPMTEAGIDGTLWRDVFVALGEPLNDGAWSVRMYVKPFISWIWLGAIIMGIGGVLGILDRRYRRPQKTPMTENTNA